MPSSSGTPRSGVWKLSFDSFGFFGLVSVWLAARYGSMKALKLLTGLGSPVIAAEFRLELSVSGTGGGGVFDIDFFRRLKKDDGFLLRTGC